MKNSYNHHHVSREKVPSQGRANSRTERRKAERKAATAAKKQRIRERIAANPRLVRA